MHWLIICLIHFYWLTLCLLGSFSCFFYVCRFFSNSTFLKNSFRSYHQLVKQLTVWIKIRLTYVRPDLGPNCLQRLSADDTWMQRVNTVVSKAAWKTVQILIRWLCQIWIFTVFREPCGSVVECLTGDRGAVGSSFTCITAFCP